MQLIKCGEKINKYLFSIGVMMELLVMMTDHFASWTLPYRGRVTHIAFALFCLKILSTYYEKKQWIIIMLGGILGSISYITCDDEYVIRIVAFLAAAKGVDVYRVIKVIFWSALIGSCIIVALSLMGICGTIVDIRHYGRGIVESRYTLGFNHANNVHDMLWYLVSLYILQKENNMKGVNFVILTVLNVFVSYLTLSRTGFITVETIILLSLCVKYVCKEYIRKGILAITLVSLVLVIGLTIYGSIHNIVESQMVAILDKILNGRLEMLTEHANFKQWKLFPQSRSAEYIDNGFANINYCYGTVVGVAFVLLVFLLIWKSYQEKKYYLLIVLMGAILVTFMEATFVINVSLLCNMILVIACILIGNDERTAVC